MYASLTWEKKPVREKVDARGETNFRCAVGMGDDEDQIIETDQ